MPEIGRSYLLDAARPLADREGIAEVTMPRQLLVPYGGAAPVDVYVTVAAEQAIVCLVMATWADKSTVVSALGDGRKEIAALILTKGRSPAERRKSAPSSPEIKPSSKRGRRSVPGLHGSASRPVRSMPVPPAPPASELRAIPKPRESAREGTAPKRVPEDASKAEHGPEQTERPAEGGRRRISTMPELIRLELESLSLIELPEGERDTNPWVEDAVALKRASDAARFGRSVAPPRISISFEDAEPPLLARSSRATIEATPLSIGGALRKRAL